MVPIRALSAPEQGTLFEQRAERRSSSAQVSPRSSSLHAIQRGQLWHIRVATTGLLHNHGGRPAPYQINSVASCLYRELYSVCHSNRKNDPQRSNLRGNEVPRGRKCSILGHNAMDTKEFYLNFLKRTPVKEKRKKIISSFCLKYPLYLPLMIPCLLEVQSLRTMPPRSTNKTTPRELRLHPCINPTHCMRPQSCLRVAPRWRWRAV